MFKYLMLLVVMTGLLAGCSRSRDAEAKAYAAGCAGGINIVLQSMAAQPNEAKVVEHCAQAAQEYLKNNK